MVKASGIGLALATATSVVNVMTDICRKKSVEENDIIGTWFWISGTAALVFGCMFAFHLATVPGPLLHPVGALFGHMSGGFGATWPPPLKFAVCLLLDGGLETAALYYYLRALQVSDLSITVPFLAFTPVLLIPTGYLFLHEMPNLRQGIGVLLVVCGSLTINKRALREGWIGPVKAVFAEPGSRYMLLVALCFALTNPMDKIIVLMSDPVTAAFGYGMTLWAFYTALMIARRKTWGSALKQAPRWIVMAGILYASTQLLQFTSHRYIDVVLTITIKRAGILLSVLAGWLIFRERDVEDRLIAAFVMLCGVFLIYLPFGVRLQMGIVVLVLVTLAVSLRTSLRLRPKP